MKIQIKMETGFTIPIVLPNALITSRLGWNGFLQSDDGKKIKEGCTKEELEICYREYKAAWKSAFRNFPDLELISVEEEGVQRVQVTL